MKKSILCVWLLVPVAAGAYHMGPGQDRMLLDDAARLIESGKQHVELALELTAKEGEQAAIGEWADAEEAYAQALALLPDEPVRDRRRLRLERAKCQMNISQLPLANSALRGLVDELRADAGADAQILREARRAFANSEYYMTWLMRLEGAAREIWEPRIEEARQTFKLLAEEASNAGDEAACQKDRQDLESAIRLARMDLSELQGLPLPSQ